MTLKVLLEIIARIAKENPLIHWSGAGQSIYSLNAETIRNYPMFYCSPTGQHTYETNTTEYSLTFFYIDRLLEDSTNDIQCFSTGIEVLKAIILQLENTDGIIEIERPIQFLNFTETERLSDRCAGAYANVIVRVQNNFVCA